MNAPSPAAIQGTFADLKSVKTRSVVQLIIECPIEQAAEIVRLFGFPQPGQEIPVAVARLKAVAQIDAKVEKPRRSFEDMNPAQQAGILCNDARFQKFLEEERPNQWRSADSTTEDAPDASITIAAKVVRAICGVRSRSDLISNPQATIAWQDLENEYRTWLTA